MARAKIELCVADVIGLLLKGQRGAGVAAKLAASAAWPPNVFAVTSVLLADSGAYRLAVSPHGASAWPPDGDWSTRVEANGAAWMTASAQNAAPPARVLELCTQLTRALGLRIRALADEEHRAVAEDILELHATADVACQGVGIPLATTSYIPSEAADFITLANMLLTDNGTLATLSTDLVRVLPKLRTPQSGITLRSLSHNLAIDRSEVAVHWTHHETLCLEQEGRFNLLVIPWPFEIQPNAFSPAPSVLANMDSSHFGFFAFDPPGRLSPDIVSRLVIAAKERVGAVHGVVLPEGALLQDELAPIKSRLLEQGVSMLVTGVRGNRCNYAHLATAFQNVWRASDQHKHHRWCLDRTQIHQYHLGSVLHPGRRWWEDISITPRELNFVTANGWLTVCHLICEDLARQEPVAQVVRSVGPTLLIALLLDGPQLEARWPARYATVFADDPGSSVLTVTSLGMALRSWSPQHAPSRVVALWKDQRRGPQQISLERDHQALLLSLTADYVEEWSADGRTDGKTAAELVLSAVEQIKP